MKLFKCQYCAQLLYFENTLCIKCGHRLGYIPSREALTALEPQGLRRYYTEGAAPDWQDNFVSAYASCHPWEDFAETWAHYLHIVDTLEMARALGLYINPPIAQAGELEAVVDFQPYRAPDATTLVKTWIPLSNALNALNRTMGQPDLYPFVLTPTVINKLGAIHDLVHIDRLDSSTSRAQPAGREEHGPSDVDF